MAYPSVDIIDDEKTIRDSLEQAFEDIYDIRTFATGNQGLETISKDPPDIVLLDISLPDINGITVLKQLLEKRPDLPVIMITAHGELETVTRALNRGAVDYLVKPLHTESLEKAITDTLAG